MQRHFHEELDALKQTLLAMGGLVEDQIRRVMRALIERDSELAQDVIDRDRQVNAYDVEIDEKCVELLALHQPTAGDLRFITTAMKIVTDLEGIVERSLKAAALWDEVYDRLNESALGLSGGQQQRLCIARAIAVEPDVLLMDEPCSALDPIATAKIEELMLELKNSYTIVIVTHNMQQAARVSDYTGFMLLGELVEVGVTRELFTNPRNKRTEDYITGRFG